VACGRCNPCSLKQYQAAFIVSSVYDVIFIAEDHAVACCQRRRPAIVGAACAATMVPIKKAMATATGPWPHRRRDREVDQGSEILGRETGLICATRPRHVPPRAIRAGPAARVFGHAWCSLGPAGQKAKGRGRRSGHDWMTDGLPPILNASRLLLRNWASTRTKGRPQPRKFPFRIMTCNEETSRIRTRN